MKAQIGDRVVVEGTNLGDRRRVGVVVRLRHPDGTPPYVVRWLDDDHESLMFPGPTTHVERGAHSDDDRRKVESESRFA